MARINLLPWREELRKERQQQFMMVTGLMVVLTLAVVGLVHFQISSIIDGQVARNTYLEQEIKVLDKKIKEIQDLEKEKARLLARMNIIQELQSSRPQVVHVFDELVGTLPEGVYLTSIKNAGSNLTIEGIAQSNARVSSYMRNIDSAGWLSNPRLDVIETQDKERERVSRFVLNAKQTSPKSGDNSKGGEKRGS